MPKLLCSRQRFTRDRMASSSHALPRPLGHRREEVVVQQSPEWQNLPFTILMAGGTFDSYFWTDTLKRLGLESPGRQEAVQRAMERTRQRHADKAHRQTQKSKRGGRRKWLRLLQQSGRYTIKRLCIRFGCYGAKYRRLLAASWVNTREIWTLCSVVFIGAVWGHLFWHHVYRCMGSFGNIRHWLLDDIVVALPVKDCVIVK